MNLQAKWRDAARGAFAVAAVTVLLGLIFLIFPVGNNLVRMSYDLPFLLRASDVPKDALMVYMDEDSHSALGQEYQTRWDRRVHTQLLQKLCGSGIRAVVFDVLFDDPTSNDVEFAQAIKSCGNVVLAGRFMPVPRDGVTFWQTRKPLEQFQRGAVWGVAEMPVAADSVVRQHYRVQRHSTNIMSMAWRGAQLTGKAPSNPHGVRWINYYGPPLSLPWVSYAQVLSNEVSAAAISNKVAFVGARIITPYTGGKGTTDEFPTPYSRSSGIKAPGVEINATAFLNLIRGDWLEQLSPVREFLLVIGVGLVFGVGLNFLRAVPLVIVALAGAILLFGLACWSAWHLRVWFPWAIPCLVQIPVATAGAFVYTAHRLYRGSRDLERKLHELPAGAANVTPPAGILPADATPTLIRQQLQELLPAPSLDGGLNAPTATSLPVVPDCHLLRRIGAGAFGEVWLARNVIGAYRALKIVYRSNFEEERPYQREFEGIKHFDPISRNHPGLVHLLHVGRNDALGYFYYEMELADDASGAQPFDPERYQAKTLGKELQQKGRMPLEQCIELGLSLAGALAYLHERGLIHRDIKPANIIFVNGAPKLADIGLVTQIGEGRTFVGTEGFFPPEGPGSPAADVYSLGKVLYEVFTGLSRQNFPDLPSNLTANGDARIGRFNKILMRACEDKVSRRYRSAQELQAALQELTGQRRRLFGLLRTQSK